MEHLKNTSAPSARAIINNERPDAHIMRVDHNARMGQSPASNPGIRTFASECL